jgi:hypothetical protein
MRIFLCGEKQFFVFFVVIFIFFGLFEESCHQLIFKCLFFFFQFCDVLFTWQFSISVFIQILAILKI